MLCLAAMLLWPQTIMNDRDERHLFFIQTWAQWKHVICLSMSVVISLSPKAFISCSGVVFPLFPPPPWKKKAPINTSQLAKWSRTRPPLLWVLMDSSQLRSSVCEQRLERQTAVKHAPLNTFTHTLTLCTINTHTYTHKHRFVPISCNHVTAITAEMLSVHKWPFNSLYKIYIISPLCSRYTVYSISNYFYNQHKIFLLYKNTLIITQS